jgi:DNA-binding CsgD family transcriptional regulator
LPTSAVTRLDTATRLGLLRARRGDPGAWDAIDDAVRAAERFGDRDRLGAAYLAAIEAAYLDGDSDRARDVAARSIAAENQTPTDRLAWWARRLGLDTADPAHARRPFAAALNGDHRGAAAAFAAIGWRYEEALALFDTGDAAALRQALQILQVVGAKPMARLVKQRLRAEGHARLPRGPRAATVANPAHLTAREVEVLSLLGSDRTNRDIAAELVVSVRTVEHHVASVLAKLDVTSRRDAATKAATLGLLQTA